MKSKLVIDERQAVVTIVAVLLVAAGGFSSCSDSPSAASPSADGVSITLPDGAVIRAEVVSSAPEQQRGLMFRRELAADRGMLFNFSTYEEHTFWMFQTLIPLDIIWIDPEGVIVEISADTPPCGSTNPSDCPNYGGSVKSQYVLELAGGQAAAHQLQVGDRIRF